MLLFFLFQCHLPEGSLVPKKLYMSDDDSVDRLPIDDSPFNSDSIYHTAHVVKEYPHEVRTSLMRHIIFCHIDYP